MEKWIDEGKYKEVFNKYPNQSTKKLSAALNSASSLLQIHDGENFATVVDLDTPMQPGTIEYTEISATYSLDRLLKKMKKNITGFKHCNFKSNKTNTLSFIEDKTSTKWHQNYLVWRNHSRLDLLEL